MTSKDKSMKHFEGTLVLSDIPEDMNRMNYGILDSVTNKFDSISDELERIYNSGFNLVRIELRQFENNHCLQKIGALHIGKDKYGVDGWFINGLPFDFELDWINRNGNKKISIEIHDFITIDTQTSEDTPYDTRIIS